MILPEFYAQGLDRLQKINVKSCTRYEYFVPFIDLLRPRFPRSVWIRCKLCEAADPRAMILILRVPYDVGVESKLEQPGSHRHAQTGLYGNEHDCSRIEKGMVCGVCEAVDTPRGNSMHLQPHGLAPGRLYESKER